MNGRLVVVIGIKVKGLLVVVVVVVVVGGVKINGLLVVVG